MIHYHGVPITPDTAATRALSCGHAFVSFLHPDQLGLVVEVASSFALDNGAFSAWRGGAAITDWSDYYAWIAAVRRCPGFDFAVIPDVIDGSEKDNDALIHEWPHPIWTGAPVWHMHESLKRLQSLCETWPRVCLGSSGAFAQIGTQAWWRRIGEAMEVICDPDGRPLCKIHGLRMLDPDVYTRIPFSSADSTNIGRNIGIDGAWRGTYKPPTKEARAAIMRERIESQQSPARWDRSVLCAQQTLFELTAI